MTWGFHIGRIDHEPPFVEKVRDVRDDPDLHHHFTPVTKPVMDHVSYVRMRNKEGWK